jgi:hypothetical protein
MICLTPPEFQEWASSFNVRVESNRNLVFAKEFAKVMSGLPEKASSLFAFSTALVEWLPPNIERAFYLSDWPLYTPEQMIVFNKLRLVCGESRHLIDAPAHLFDGRSLLDRYDTDDIPRLTADPVLQECTVMAGLIFLAMTFQWQGYILAKDDSAHVYLGDEFIVFFTNGDERLGHTRELLNRFKLKAK